MTFPLLSFLAILATEYLGIAYHYVPALNKLPVILVFSFLMAMSLMSKYGAGEFFRHTQTKLFIAFIFMTAAAMVYGLVRTYAVELLKQQVGYFILAMFAYYAMRQAKAIRWYMAALVAFHVLLVVLNASKFAQAERAGAFKAGYFMGDGNDFAWSLVVAFPMAFYFLTAMRPLWLKLFGGVGAFMIVVGILGTQSRGSSLALAATLVYYWVMLSKQKAASLLLIACFALGGLALAPAGYFSRMETLATYEEDTSATGRLRAWGHAIDMAVDSPLLGVGAGSFNSAYGRFYRDIEGGDPTRWISTHSIYFKVLGEYGFTGVILLLSIIWVNYRDNRRTGRFLRTRVPQDPSVSSLPEFINMS